MIYVVSSVKRPPTPRDGNALTIINICFNCSYKRLTKQSEIINEERRSMMKDVYDMTDA